MLAELEREIYKAAAQRMVAMLFDSPVGQTIVGTTCRTGDSVDFGYDLIATGGASFMQGAYPLGSAEWAGAMVKMHETPRFSRTTLLTSAAAIAKA